MASFFQVNVTADATQAASAIARTQEQIAGLYRVQPYMMSNTPTYTWSGTWNTTANAMAWPGTTGTGYYRPLDVQQYWYAYSGVGVTEQMASAEVRINADLFEDHPDPDAVLGEQMDVLRKQLEEALGMTIARDAVWENWCGGEAWEEDVVIKAQWTPRALTIEAWDAWQKLPKMRRVYDQRTRRYTEITEAEFRKREREEERRRLIIRNRQRTSELRARIAARRAEELLLAHLDEEQAAEWVASKQFHVHTADGERTYRIKRGRAGNIYLVKGQHPTRPHVKRFCFHEYHPDGGVPMEDNVLAQKLFIEANEEEFFRVANPA